jgi:heat shock protein HslJ
MKYLVMPLLAFAVLAVMLATGCQDLKSPLEDRDWVLVSYQELNGTVHDALPGVPVTARFDSEKGQVGGSGGCNSYGGEYTVDKLELTIRNMAWTERACLEPERNAQETAFFTALQKAEGFRVGHNTLTITGRGWELNFDEATPAP